MGGVASGRVCACSLCSRLVSQAFGQIPDIFPLQDHLVPLFAGIPEAFDQIYDIFSTIFAGIPEASITWGQNSRLVANGTSLLHLWDSPLFQVIKKKKKKYILTNLIA